MVVVAGEREVQARLTGRDVGEHGGQRVLPVGEHVGGEGEQDHRPGQQPGPRRGTPAGQVGSGRERRGGGGRHHRARAAQGGAHVTR